MTAKYTPAIDRFHSGGAKQLIYWFGNGYGASIVCGEYTYGGDKGLWELAVITRKSDNPLDFDLCYDTPITDDVLGWLTREQVEETLAKIEALPERSAA